ncbi:MAG: hypothetical protein GF365_00830 [Candidatus Buchananbacteria bacterium]|nr:hypothetical protein [Candidatus Buchananbacteria bacterium]
MKGKIKKDKIIAQLEKTPIIQIACERTGISRATFYRWRKSDKKFAKRVNKALNEGTELVSEMAESQLISAIKDRNLTAIIFWLKNHRQAYGNKLEIQGSLKTNFELSEDQKETIKKALELSSLIKDEELKK